MRKAGDTVIEFMEIDGWVGKRGMGSIVWVCFSFIPKFAISNREMMIKQCMQGSMGTPFSIIFRQTHIAAQTLMFETRFIHVSYWVMVKRCHSSKR